MFTHYIKSNGSDDVGDCWGLVSVANLFFSTLNFIPKTRSDQTYQATGLDWSLINIIISQTMAQILLSSQTSPGYKRLLLGWVCDSISLSP